MGCRGRIALLSDGDHFGEIALLDAVPRTASVRTLTHYVIALPRRDDLARMLVNAPAVARRLRRARRRRMAAEPGGVDRAQSTHA